MTPDDAQREIAALMSAYATDTDPVLMLAQQILDAVRDVRAALSAAEADSDALQVALDNARDELREALGVLRDLIRGDLPIDHAVEWLNEHAWQLHND